MGLFIDRYLCLSSVFTVIVIVDLLLDFEGDFPALVGDFEVLALLGQLLRQFREEVIGSEVREDSVGRVGVKRKLLQSEPDDLAIVVAF